MYRAAGDPDTGYAEQEHMRLMSFYNSVALAAGRDEPEWFSSRHDTTLPEWLSHKRQHLPDALSVIKIVESDLLHRSELLFSDWLMHSVRHRASV